jgi:hypothetical protein
VQNLKQFAESFAKDACLVHESKRMELVHVRCVNRHSHESPACLHAVSITLFIASAAALTVCAVLVHDAADGIQRNMLKHARLPRRCIAVCLREPGSTTCSVRVWSMQGEECSLEALVLAAQGNLRAGSTALAYTQQMLAVCSEG